MIKEEKKTFIDIVLYLLLALAFFSEYWNSSSMGPLIFLSGMLTIILLMISSKLELYYLWTILFITFFSIHLGILYLSRLGVTYFWGILTFLNMGSLMAILLIAIFMLFYFIHKKKNTD